MSTKKGATFWATPFYLYLINSRFVVTLFLLRKTATTLLPLQNQHLVHCRHCLLKNLRSDHLATEKFLPSHNSEALIGYTACWQ